MPDDLDPIMQPLPWWQIVAIPAGLAALFGPWQAQVVYLTAVVVAARVGLARG